MFISVNSVRISAKNPGMLEVPEGKSIMDLPVDHFQELVKRKGLSPVMKALVLLEIWNKNDDPHISEWARRMKKQISPNL